MTPSVLSETSYVATRSTIATSVGFAEFQARFEKAVPRVMGIISVLAAYTVPWAEVVSMTAEAAPHGFLMYLDAPVDRIMRIAGHDRRTCSYLIGNHVDAERMYRHSPAVMVHSPLRVVLWEDENGQAMFTFDHPAPQFSCFDDPRIAAVGIEISGKFARLLRHLGLPLPYSLGRHEPQIDEQAMEQAASLPPPRLPTQGCGCK
jgi:uncharacterized protein (DUF302 family)